MKNYVFTYHSSQTTPPSAEVLQQWGEWMDTLGEHLVDGGNPTTSNKAVLRLGEVLKNEPDTLIGYSIIKAESLDEAVKLAKGSPLANVQGGELHVYETGQM